MHDLAEFVDRYFRIFQFRHAGVDNFAEVVGRNVRRHANGNATCAVDKQVREFGGENSRLLQLAIIVVAKIDGVVTEIVEQESGDFGKARFRVALGGRRVTIDRAEIALAINKWNTQRKILRHAHQRVVYRQVTVRVILAHHLADDAGALDVLFVPLETKFAHRKQNAAVHGLQAVAHVRQRARDDDAHRVVEIRPLHLLGDCNRAHVARVAACRFAVVASVGQRVSSFTKMPAQQP